MSDLSIGRWQFFLNSKKINAEEISKLLTLNTIHTGCYFPAISSLRSELLPESCRAGVLSWFRLPVNLITCLTLVSLNLAVQRETVLLLAGHLCLAGALFTLSYQEPHVRNKLIIM